MGRVSKNQTANRDELKSPNPFELTTNGNLGRAGYGASNDGVWPYSYNECDVGTLPNQT